MKNLVNNAWNVLVLTALATTLASCGGGGGSSSSSSSGGSYHGPDFYSSPNITATKFVDALNDVDEAGYYDENELIKDTYETERAGDWFVIWDEKNMEYVAVDLDYIKTLEYIDYYSNQYDETASEFRDQQADDEYWNGLIGDGFGDDYEIVDYVGEDYWGDPVFEGIDSGYLYEDEEESHDVSLMAGEQEQKQFYTKAAQVSFTYNVDMKTSLALVTLGKKVENMLVKTNGELTAEDQAALMGDLVSVTGVSLDELNEAAQSPEKKEALVETIAEKIGTSADNLENRLLPEVFGLSL